MDLISRKLIIEEANERQKNGDYITKGFIKSLPSAFKGMTNGEVMKAVFPNMTVTHKSSNGVLIVVENLDSPYPHEFYTEWWNSPYQKGGEGDK